MDLSKGKIYKLVSFQTDKVYVGSTCSLLSKRFYEHKMKFKKSHDKLNLTSFEILKYADCDIILLEDFPCENRNQLHARERYYIESLSCVNKNIPTRTRKEYAINNKDKLNALKRVKHDCECGSKYTSTHKSDHAKTKRHKKFIEEKQSNEQS